MREQSQEAKEAGFEAFVDERNRADFAEWWKRFCMESGRPMTGPLREVAEIVWLAARDHPPSEAKQGGWIALKERRPTGRDEVLTCSLIGRFVSTRGASWVRSLWAEAEQNGEDCAITHWQPLPEPPSEYVKHEGSDA